MLVNGPVDLNEVDTHSNIISGAGSNGYWPTVWPSSQYVGYFPRPRNSISPRYFTTNSLYSFNSLAVDELIWILFGNPLLITKHKKSIPFTVQKQIWVASDYKANTLWYC